MTETNGKTEDVAEESQTSTESDPESKDDKVAAAEPEATTEEKSKVAVEDKAESEPEEGKKQTAKEKPETPPEAKATQSGGSTDLIIQEKENSWVVCDDGSDKIIERFDTRAEAFRHARKLTSSQGGEVYILVS